MIKRIEFTQEGDSIIFYPKEGQTGWDIAKAHFQDACDYQESAGCCIVKTQCLQEMGFSLDVG